MLLLLIVVVIGDDGLKDVAICTATNANATQRGFGVIRQRTDKRKQRLWEGKKSLRPARRDRPVED